MTDPNDIYNNIVIFQDRALTETVTLNGFCESPILEDHDVVDGRRIGHRDVEILQFQHRVAATERDRTAGHAGSEL